MSRGNNLNYGRQVSRPRYDTEEEEEFVEQEQQTFSIYDSCVLYIATMHDLGLYAARQVVNTVWYDSSNQGLSDTSRCQLTIKLSDQIIRDRQVRERFDN